MTTDNLYLTLDLFLDPPETGFEALKQLLRQKIGEWNRLKNADHRYDYMVQVANNFIQQQTMPPELEAQAMDAVAARMRELKSAVEACELDGVLEQAELEQVLRRFRPYFMEQTIRGMFSLDVFEFPVPPEPGLPQGVREIPRAEMDALEADLKILGKKDLYDLLGAARTSSVKTLLTRQSAAYQQAHLKPKSGPQKAQTDAELRLLGKAKKIFADEPSRQGYDLALKRRPFDELTNNFFELIARKKNVTYEEYVGSIEKAREVGLSQAEAEWYVYDYYCRQRRIPPPRRLVEVSRRVQCPECFRLNDASARVCVCGIPLKVKCPRCGREGSFGDMACTGCGFPVGNMANAVHSLRDARAAVANNDIPAAEEAMRQVNTFWRDCPGTDDVRRLIADWKAGQARLLAQIRKLETAILDAMRKRRFYEAQRLLADLRKIPAADGVLAREQRDVEKSLERIQPHLTDLRGTKDTLQRMTLCQAVLEQVADCQEAQLALDQCPMLPPTDLQARVTPAGAAELQWQAPPLQKTTAYVVVRKAGAAPASPEDGDTLSDAFTNTAFVDTGCEPGVIYGYAVFAKRGTQTDPHGCRSELVQRIDRLAGVEVLPGNRTLTFSWRKPANCLGIRVTRWPAANPHDETPLPEQHGTGFVDAQLENGTGYVYRFQPVIRGIHGEEIHAAELRVEAKPLVPPPPVENLRCEQTPDGVTLCRWTPPARGEVALFHLTEPPAEPVGKVAFTTLLELQKRYGSPIPVTHPRKGQARCEDLSAGIHYILPVTLLDGLAVFGRAATAVRVPDVGKLEASISGANVYLSWGWPAGLEKVLVTWRHDRLPEGRDDPEAETRVFTRPQYDAEKAFVAEIKQTRDFYFRVHAMVEHQGQPSCSPGVEVQTTLTVIRWQVRVSRKCWLFGDVRRAELRFEVESGMPGLPEMVLRRETGHPPLNRKYGVPVMDIPADERAAALRVSLDPAIFTDKAYFAVFVRDETEARRYTLYGPSQAAMKLQTRLATFRGFLQEFLRHPLRFWKTRGG